MPMHCCNCVYWNGMIQRLKIVISISNERLNQELQGMGSWSNEYRGSGDPGAMAKKCYLFRERMEKRDSVFDILLAHSSIQCAPHDTLRRRSTCTSVPCMGRSWTDCGHWRVRCSRSDSTAQYDVDRWILRYDGLDVQDASPSCKWWGRRIEMVKKTGWHDDGVYEDGAEAQYMFRREMVPAIDGWTMRTDDGAEGVGAKRRWPKQRSWLEGNAFKLFLSGAECGD